MSDRGPWRRRAARTLAVPVLAAVVASLPADLQAQRGRPTARRPAARPVGPPPNPSPLRGAAVLQRVYDFILDARFDQVDSELGRACGPAPPEACEVLAATAIWWRIQLDPLDPSLDDEFSTAVDRAIASTTAWSERSPDDAEAWFYLGGAYGARVQWRVLRDQKLAAARDGKQIKQALERAITLDPSLADAHFGIGLYKYYAAVAPAAARFLRFLLLLPGGNREDGLEEMRRARDQGRLLQGEADYQLHLIYLWYEHEPQRALTLLRKLQQQYPGNPLFVTAIADVQDTYLHDTTASLDTWRMLLSLARDQRVNAPVLAEVQARLGIAHHLDALYQTDLAIEQLQAIVERGAAAPYSSLALAYQRLGAAQDRLGARTAAVAAYRQALALAPADDPLEVKKQASEALRHAPDPRLTEAYRVGLDGWRRFETNQIDAAATALARSLALDDRDAVMHYRYGRVLQALKDDERALSEFETAIRDGRGCPAPILATAYLEAARLHERAGDRGQASDAYAHAASLFGAAAETRAVAARALDRLTR